MPVAHEPCGVATKVGVAVCGTGVEVGGTGVDVGTIGVAVGELGVGSTIAVAGAALAIWIGNHPQRTTAVATSASRMDAGEDGIRLLIRGPYRKEYLAKARGETTGND